MLDHKAIAKLHEKNEARNVLSSLWHDRFKLDPIDSAIRIREERKRYLRDRTMTIASSCITCFGIVAISEIIPYSGHLDQTAFFTARILLGLTFFFTGSELFRAVLAKWQQDRYTDAEWDYPYHFGQFLMWSEMTPRDVLTLSKDKAKAIARKILSQTAERAHRKQIRLKAHPGEIRLELEANAARKLFDEQLQTFAILSIVEEGSHQSFFNSAERYVADQALDGLSICSDKRILVHVCHDDVYTSRFVCELTEGSVTIGSGSQCDIKLGESAPSLAALIKKADSGVVWLRSRTVGISVNSSPITESEIIKNGAEIRIGDYTLIVYLFHKTSSETETSAHTIMN